MPQNAQQRPPEVRQLREPVALNPLSGKAYIASPGRMHDVAAKSGVHPLDQNHVAFVDQQVPGANQLGSGAQIHKLVTPQKALGAELNHEGGVQVRMRHPGTGKDELREVAAVKAAVTTFGTLCKTRSRFGQFGLKTDVATVAVLRTADFGASHRIGNIGRLEKLGGRIDQGLLPGTQRSLVPVENFGFGVFCMKCRGKNRQAANRDPKTQNQRNS